MGPTGVGKTTFIRYATDQSVQNIGRSLDSDTAEIQSVKVRHPDRSKNRGIIFVDTPGFDDTNKADIEVLQLLADWLMNAYKRKKCLSGVIYLHRITDNRMAGSSLKNLRMFASLCGDRAIRNVVLGTTMWSKVKQEMGTQRETELHDKHWKSMLARGSKTARFGDSFDSAWKIVDVILECRRADPLLLQEEIVDLHKPLSDTQAGRTMCWSLQKLLTDHKKTVRNLRQEIRCNQGNPAHAQALRTQCNEADEILQEIRKQVRKMKVPIQRRILSIFSFRKSRAVSMINYLHMRR
ncbi:hypothetical protein BD410DRAFT_730415 [Rickenella mellea]|uniref:G domain-containing protein n=1 Tax=Rickenella mellea TaxID=50990 RepID=A0A4Y7PP24_9AGAM|nr:hypothetical protein BD410DRAFT_730415 [Rickenella mellea]